MVVRYTYKPSFVRKCITHAPTQVDRPDKDALGTDLGSLIPLHVLSVNYFKKWRLFLQEVKLPASFV
jgi:hypothetical protein